MARLLGVQIFGSLGRAEEEPDDQEELDVEATDSLARGWNLTIPSLLASGWPVPRCARTCAVLGSAEPRLRSNF